MTFRERFSKQVHGIQVPWHEHDPGDIAGQIASRLLAAASVVTSKIADLAVTTPKLADAAVTDLKVADGIDGAKLADGTVDTPELAADAVTNLKIANNAVDTPELVDAAVTDPKVAFGIDGAKIADGTISTAEIGDDQVTAGKLAGGAVSAYVDVDRSQTAANTALTTSFQDLTSFNIGRPSFVGTYVLMVEGWAVIDITDTTGAGGVEWRVRAGNNNGATLNDGVTSNGFAFPANGRFGGLTGPSQTCAIQARLTNADDAATALRAAVSATLIGTA